MCSKLQPYGIRAATVSDPGCNPMASGLQPYVVRNATLWHPGCNPMCPRLQPYVAQVRRGDTLLNTRTGEREVAAQP